MYLLTKFNRSSGQKQRRLKEYLLNTTAGASVGGAISSLLSAKNPSNIPKNIIKGALVGGTISAYNTYRTRKNRNKEKNIINKYVNSKLY